MKLFQLKKEIFALLVVMGMLTAGFLCYSSLPNEVPTHWNIEGEVDDWSSSFTVAFTMPLIYLGTYLFLSFLVLLDPFRKNIENFYGVFWKMKLAIILFLAGLQATILTNALTNINLAVDKIVILEVAALFIFLGALMPKFKRNFFIGIRFPWTITSEEVWRETHKQGRIVFVLLGIIVGLSTLFSGKISFIILMTSIFSALIYLGIYSYLRHKKLPENKKLNI